MLFDYISCILKKLFQSLVFKNKLNRFIKIKNFGNFNIKNLGNFKDLILKIKLIGC